MAHAEVGAYDDAVRWQRDLVTRAEQMGRADLVALFRGNLKRYENDRPVRAPWKAGS